MKGLRWSVSLRTVAIAWVAVAVAASAMQTMTGSLRKVIGEISESMHSLAASTERVAGSSGVTQHIAREVLVVDQTASEMAEGSEQVRTSASELSKIAEHLRHAILQFNVSNQK